MATAQWGTTMGDGHAGVAGRNEVEYILDIRRIDQSFVNEFVQFSQERGYSCLDGVSHCAQHSEFRQIYSDRKGHE